MIMPDLLRLNKPGELRNTSQIHRTNDTAARESLSKSQDGLAMLILKIKKSPVSIKPQ